MRSDADAEASAVTDARSSCPCSLVTNARSRHFLHVSPNRLQQKGDENDDDDEIDFGYHRGITDIGTVAIFAIDETRNRVGRSARSACSDVDDDVGEL